MVSFMSDSRVAFLIWFISIAIVIASGLIFAEIRLKRKRARDAERKKVSTPIDKMRAFLNGDASVREKLDVIGNTAKDYFKTEDGLSERLGYRELSNEFRTRGKELEVRFCEDMFGAYYSDHELSDVKIKKLGDMLAEICKKKTVAIKLSRAPGWGDRMDRFMEGVRDAVTSKVDDYVKVKSEKIERAARVEKREEHELSSWVRKAIDMGYDKMKVFSLLDDGKRSKKEVKKVLSVYEKEAVKTANKKDVVPQVSAGSGIAQRIIQKEKDRLEDEGI